MERLTIRLFCKRKMVGVIVELCQSIKLALSVTSSCNSPQQYD